MPEGHTIHRAARDHARDLAGQTLRVTSPQGRFEGAAEVDGQMLRAVEAHGKHLFYVFEGGRTVHVHLGLYGRFFRRRSPAPPPRPTTRMRLEAETWTVDLIGPTACELVTKAERAAIHARLGPDPLREGDDPKSVVLRLAVSAVPIAAALLDQSVLAGVGNVYRAEVLHLVKLHPDTPSRAVPPATLRKMWKLLVGLMRRGVEEKRIVTTRGPTLAKPRVLVPRGERLHVYGRRACFSCDGAVNRVALRGRTSWWCPTCQPFDDASVTVPSRTEQRPARTRARRTSAS
jgi:endonuclease-8